jgi:Bacterial Ig-like domain (group 3)
MTRRAARIGWRAVVGCLFAAALAGGGVLAAAAPATATPAAPTTAAGTWQTAKTVELPPAFNRGGPFATINSISCPSPGNCTAVGQFTDENEPQAFAVSEVNHTWKTAVEPLGTVAAPYSDPDLVDVSCASAGNCTAAGMITYNKQYTDAEAVTEINGFWSESGIYAGYEKGAQENAVSCPPKAATECINVGSYVDASGKTQTLGGPANVATLNAGGNAAITSISCPSAGNCAVGGYYTDVHGSRQAFVATEKKGTWRNAREVAGTLNSGGHAQVNSVSCGSAGNCVAVGQYFGYVNQVASTEAFEVTEKNGAWSSATQVPGTGSLNVEGLAIATAVSCAPASGPLSCALGGHYYDKNGHQQAFVDVLKKGAWQKASSIGTGHNVGGYAQVSTVSCPAAGDCAAGGFYLTAPGSSQKYQAFLVTLEGFTWQPVEEVAGSLNTGMTAQVNSVSCPSVSFCAAGGFYTDALVDGTLAFTVDGAVTQSTKTALSMSAATARWGHEQAEHIAVAVTPADAGPATGTVTVAAGKTVLCTLKLASGKASCTLAAKKLGAGSYHVTASYAGATYFAKSASAAKPLKVTG